MFFRQVIGQEDIKAQLCRKVEENRFPHALLFCGISGSGKLPLALACARYLLCQNPLNGDACGQCPDCKKLDKLAHPDLHFVYPVVRSKDSKVTISDQYLPEWRERLLRAPYFDLNDWLTQIRAENQQALIYAAESDSIQRKLNLKSSEGGRKVMLIWLPEKMNTECANKLLKLFEEPPAQTHFLLVSEEPDRLLATILSRTQRIKVHGLDTNLLKKILIETNGIDEHDAEQIARQANGSYTKALHTLQVNQDQTLFFDLFVMLMRLSYQRKIKEMHKWSEQIATFGREKQKNFLEYCQQLIRENFMYNFQLPELNYLNGQERDFSKKFARFINERNVIKIMEELSNAQRDIEQNVNPKMVFFDFSLKTIVLLIQ